MSRSVGGTLPIRRGAAAGAGAMVAVAVITFGLLRTGIGYSSVQTRIAEEIPITAMLGGVLDMHSWFVGTQLGGGSRALTIIPILVLLAAGFVAAQGTRPGSVADGFASGATVALGYLGVLVVLVVLMLTVGTAVGGGSGPVLPLVITGIVYPILAGGIGGVIANSTLAAGRGTPSA